MGVELIEWSSRKVRIKAKSHRIKLKLAEDFTTIVKRHNGFVIVSKCSRSVLSAAVGSFVKAS